MRISDWSSDVCSSDLGPPDARACNTASAEREARSTARRKSWVRPCSARAGASFAGVGVRDDSFSPSNMPRLGAAFSFARSDEHTSELQSLLRDSYAVLGLKKKSTHPHHTHHSTPRRHTSAS